MSTKVFKVSRKYLRSGKKVKFMGTGRGSRVNRAELVPPFRAQLMRAAVYLVDTKDYTKDFIKPPHFQQYQNLHWPRQVHNNVN